MIALVSPADGDSLGLRTLRRAIRLHQTDQSPSRNASSRTGVSLTRLLASAKVAAITSASGHDSRSFPVLNANLLLLSPLSGRQRPHLHGILPQSRVSRAPEVSAGEVLRKHRRPDSTKRDRSEQTFIWDEVSYIQHREVDLNAV